MNQSPHHTNDHRKPQSGSSSAERGWWASVEIVRNRPGRKSLQEALSLLAQGFERYDIIVHSGRTLARGLFGREADMLGLASLLEIATRWSGTSVHVNGLELNSEAAKRFIRQLTCAGTEAPCCSSNMFKRDEFLGCHLAGIGFLGFSAPKLLKGRFFWFSFLKKVGDRQLELDRTSLEKALFEHSLCPLHPERCHALFKALPEKIDLGRTEDSVMWVPTRKRIRSRWETRFPLVVPRRDILYERWGRELAQLASFEAARNQNQQSTGLENLKPELK